MQEIHIPIVFSCDDNYLPCLAVALSSLEKNANKNYKYDIYILHSNSISFKNIRRILKEFKKDCFYIVFKDVSKEVAKYKDNFHLRDYYTISTYFRLFIPSLFPQYDKVLYLDSDIVILGDISELYFKNIDYKLLGGVVEDVMANTDVFGTYVEKALGIERHKYINAGIILINTKLFNSEHILEKFFDLINAFNFYVTQDEDYLNVLCKDRIAYFENEWNYSTICEEKTPVSQIKLLHYKMASKPWIHEGISYGDVFWKYAYGTSYFTEIMKMKLLRDTHETKVKEKTTYDLLVSRAISDSYDLNNYHNTVENNEGTEEILHERKYSI
jgi:lipopolysaccharide biosynthesis glycosyltransferase